MLNDLRLGFKGEYDELPNKLNMIVCNWLHLMLRNSEYLIKNISKISIKSFGIKNLSAINNIAYLSQYYSNIKDSYYPTIDGDLGAFVLRNIIKILALHYDEWIKIKNNEYTNLLCALILYWAYQIRWFLKTIAELDGKYNVIIAMYVFTYGQVVARVMSMNAFFLLCPYSIRLILVAITDLMSFKENYGNHQR